MTDLPPTEGAAAPTPDGAVMAPLPADATPTKPTGHTRTSGAWVGVIIVAILLTLLLVFILQNTRSVRISFFTASGAMPVGVALLLAALGGVFLAAVVASLRILELRRRLSGATPSVGRGRRRRRAGASPPGVARGGVG